jgi:hypothetical protein
MNKKDVLTHYHRQTDFYLPIYKSELVYLLAKRYPHDVSKFKRMRKKQLYAIYINLRNREG